MGLTGLGEMRETIQDKAQDPGLGNDGRVFEMGEWIGALSGRGC